MKSFDENNHSFIVRIWQEPRELEGAKPELRGEIEHVESGEGRGLKELDDVTYFIALYLPDTGVKALRPEKPRK